MAREAVATGFVVSASSAAERGLGAAGPESGSGRRVRRHRLCWRDERDVPLEGFFLRRELNLLHEHDRAEHRCSVQEE